MLSGGGGGGGPQKPPRGPLEHLQEWIKQNPLTAVGGAAGLALFTALALTPEQSQQGGGGGAAGGAKKTSFQSFKAQVLPGGRVERLEVVNESKGEHAPFFRPRFGISRNLYAPKFACA